GAQHGRHVERTAAEHDVGVVAVVVVLQVYREVARPHRADLRGRVEPAVELGGADQVAGVQATADAAVVVADRAHNDLGGVPAVQPAVVARPLRPVRVDGDGDVVLAHQPGQAGARIGGG